MVVAKNDRAHKALSAQFANKGEDGRLERGYLAFAWGAPLRPRGTIEVKGKGPMETYLLDWADQAAEELPPGR